MLKKGGFIYLNSFENLGIEGRGNKLGLWFHVGKNGVLYTSTRLRTRGFEGRGGRECVRVGERFLAPASSLFTGL